MSANAKVQKCEALKLGYLPILSLTIRHTIPPRSQTSQSLSIELLKDQQTVSLTFKGLRQLRLADLHPGSMCILNISSVTQDWMEGIRYRLFNMEQGLTLAFYCADFESSV